MTVSLPIAGQTVAQTLAEVISWRPVFEPVLRAFGPVLAAQSELAGEPSGELADCIRASGLSLPEPDAERGRQGVSLLAGAALAGVAGPMGASAEKLLPLLADIETIAPHQPALAVFFARPADEGSYGKTDDAGDERRVLAEAVVAANTAAVERIAAHNGLDPLLLGLVSGFVLAPVLRALTARALSGERCAPWNEGDFWQQGYCPVCGALPSVAWLDKPAVDEKNAYLAGGGGKKHLHCGLCGANWLFRRGACPSCAEEGNGVIEILRESGVSHGERLDWCTKCKVYCPTVDLREREFVPDLDAAALGMMHLDMVAARKKLRPLRPSFWNMF